VAKKGLGDILEEVFLKIEKCLYFVIAFGVLFLTGIVVYHSFQLSLSVLTSHHFSATLIKALDGFLVAMMFLEIFYTLHIIFGKEHVLSPEPFIIVVIIALVRRFLIVGFEVTHGAGFDPQRFKYYLIEILILGALIFVFVLSIFVLKKRERERKDE